MKLAPFDFEKDVRDFVLSKLPCEHEYLNELEAEETDQLLITYANWSERIVSKTPRIAVESQSLKTNPLRSPANFGSVVDGIIRKIQEGDDIVPHLSKAITKGYRPNQPSPKNLGARPDLDLLLSDWGVHHLHLSLNVEPDGFVSRTGPLLLVAFKSATAFLIDIIEHGQWTKRSVMETVVYEWPDEGIIYELNGALGLAESYNENEHAQLRKAGVNTALEIDGKVWMTGGGIATAGNSVASVLQANRLWNGIDQFCRKISDEPDWLRSAIASHDLPVPTTATLKFVFVEDGYGVIEETSKLFIRLSS